MKLTFHQQEQFFHELAQFARSGIPLCKSLDMIERGYSPALSRCAARLQAAMDGSDPPAMAFRKAGFSESVVAVINAAEQTGTLPQNYEKLAEYYGRLAQAKARFIRACLYPALVLHLGAFLLPMPTFIREGPAAYFRDVLIFLGGVYFLVFGIVLVCMATAAAFRNHATAAKILRAIPVLGSFLEDLSAWKFSHVFALYLKAGGSPLAGLEAAAVASDNAGFVPIVTHALSRVRSGESLTEALEERHGLPKPIQRAIEIGELAGRLDQEATRAAEFYERKTATKIDLFTEWIPRWIYIVILLLIAWQCVSAIMHILAPINSLLEGQILM